MADEPKVPDIPGGETEARIEALVEVVYELLALEDQEALKGVLDKERPADLADLITVAPETDQEEIAQLFTRYDLVAVPVEDADGRLVIHLFDVTLEKVITLAAFIPVIMATGGNSGLQSSTVTVRGLVTGHVSSGLVLRTVLREIGTAVVIGLVCGSAASGVAWFWFGEPLVGVCVGVAMFSVICIAVCLGVLAPLVFSRVGIDPAVASGPFITTTNDILGLFIYLGLATILVQRFYVGG